MPGADADVRIGVVFIAFFGVSFLLLFALLFVLLFSVPMLRLWTDMGEPCGDDVLRRRPSKLTP